MSTTSTILIVDDQPYMHESLEALLFNQGYTLCFAADGPHALEQAFAHIPDLILLDVMMPDMDGFTVCRRLRDDPRTAEVPIIFITALDDRDSRLRGIEAGGDDFLSKPINRLELRTRVQSITRLNRYRRLLTERERFQQLTELSPDGILIVDAAGHIQLVNPALVAMLALLDSASLVHQPLAAYLPPDERAQVDTLLGRLLTQQAGALRCEVTLLQEGGGYIPVEIQAGYVQWDNAPAAQLIVRDITERRQATKMLTQANQAAEERATRFRLLVEMGREFASAHHVEPLLTLALERATSFSGYDGGSILLADAPGQPLRVSASIGPNAVVPGTLVADAYHSVSGRVMREQHPLIIDGTGEHIGTDWRTYHKPIPSTISLPLHNAAGAPIGVLNLQSTHSPRKLSKDDIDALQLLASQLAVTVERARLHEERLHLLSEVESREQRLQYLVEKLLVTQEEERRRVAYELHDGLAQVASGAFQHLQTFAAQYRPRNPQKQGLLERALELAQQVVREARLVIGGLRPTVLDDFGLASALRQEVDTMRQAGWEIGYDDQCGPVRLPLALETAVYRVAQEALNNVRKHAAATCVHVRLHHSPTLVRLEVQDWGQGFVLAPSDARPNPGEQIGLISMQERIALLGGTCTIQSTPGVGTLVVAEAPLSLATTAAQPERPAL